MSTTFDGNFDSTEEYVIVYDDGRIAINMPGSTETFYLQSYKHTVGKDYKRITLLLCLESDLQIANGSDADFSAESSCEERFDDYDFVQPHEQIAPNQNEIINPSSSSSSNLSCTT